MLFHDAQDNIPYDCSSDCPQSWPYDVVAIQAGATNPAMLFLHPLDCDLNTVLRKEVTADCADRCGANRSAHPSFFILTPNAETHLRRAKL